MMKIKLNVIFPPKRRGGYAHARMKTFDLIVACTPNMGIGINGSLPWRLPKDQKYFKDVTTATCDEKTKNCCIMGRKTWESIPVKFRPLEGRVNLVLSSQKEYER